MNRILLKGCAPTPLAHYLKALGIQRLVAEQLDPKVKGAWRDDGFELMANVDDQALQDFFLNRYQPTAVLAPWNGGSGFFPSDNKDGFGPIVAGTAERFAPLRESIEQIQQVLCEESLTAKPDSEQKERLLNHLRSTLPDRALDWMDAALMLTDDGAKYPPLLGTGGNDGRLDFTNNYLKQLVALFDPNTGAPSVTASQALPNALFGTVYRGSGKGVIGQFAPGSAGGPNSSTAFEGGAHVNGWDFVLMLEGALLFAASVTRRQGHGERGSLSYPFTVRMSGSGAGNTAQADEGNARAEMWLPLWGQAVTLREIKAVLSEGRAAMNGKLCRDGLDFARAVAQLGVDRGIDAFQRYAFVMRSGKAYLATPLKKFRVEQRPEAELIADLERNGWLSRLRRLARAKEAPNSLKSAVQGLENALFDLTQRATSSTLQSILIRLGELVDWQARSRKGREASLNLPRLSSAWLRDADDGSDAFRLAAALASIGVGGALPMRAHIFPLDKGSNSWRLADNGDNATCTWGTGGLSRQFAPLLARRLQLDKQAPVGIRLAGKVPADLAAIETFLLSPDLDRQVAALLPGLALIDRPFALPNRQTDQPQLPLVYRLLKPLFCDAQQLKDASLLVEGKQLTLPSTVTRLLAANRVEEAVAEAMRRTRIAGIQAPSLAPECGAIDGSRLLAALMVPMSTNSLKHLARATYRLDAAESVRA
ncbi:type I-U CRISPR-associated protein Csx17 [Motiliproteus sp. SC1-56]|uniref:type I-G CRISPR-associated protein Cas8g1/Csx17 n=1 Tax=Motiliproteus sp. SC1-56 TaxID=2799565 RepID=UPI001A9069F3|nr:type I-U CRISPR-associated protein Csx17 [Motiliproteus sp. SC1-56]